MPEPPVSVLLPVFNAAEFLPAAVASITAQSLTEIQIVIINDGSTDASADILRNCARQDSRIELHQRPNRGLVATLNEGIGLCHGEFIARMDADDISLPLRLEKQLNHMRAHPRTVALGTAIEYLGPDGLTAVRTFPLQQSAAVTHELQRRNCISHPTVMIRKTALQTVGGYRPQYPHAEDYDLWLRLRPLGDIENLPDVHLQYRIHGNQISEKHLWLQALSVAAARLNITLDQLPAVAAEESILDTVTGWAALLIKTGQIDAACDLIADENLFYVPTLRRQASARRHWLGARVRWAQDRYLAAITEALQAAAGDPGLPVELFIRFIGRRRKRWPNLPSD